MGKNELTKKDIKTLTDEMNKVVVKLKPKDVSKTSSKTKVTRAKNKAETPTSEMKDIKNMIKEHKMEEIQNRFLDKTLRDLDLELGNKRGNDLSPQMSKVHQTLLDKIPGDQLASLDEDQLKIIAKAELAKSNPSLILQNNNSNSLKEAVDVIATVIDKVKGPEKNDDGNKDLILTLTNQVFEALKTNQMNIQNQKPEKKETLSDTIGNVKAIMSMIPQQQQSMDMGQLNLVSSLLNQALEENKEMRKMRDKELQDQANTDPIEILKYWKENLNDLRGNMGSIDSESLQLQMQLKQLDHNLSMKEWREKQEMTMKISEDKRSTETISMVRDTIEGVANKFFEFLGGAFGQNLMQQMTPGAMLGQMPSMNPNQNPNPAMMNPMNPTEMKDLQQFTEPNIPSRISRKITMPNIPNPSGSKDLKHGIRIFEPSRTKDEEY